MPNPYEVELLTTQFTTALELLLQQKVSRLRGRCASGNYVGKQASPIQQIGALQFKTPQGRFSPLARQEAEYTRRWVFPNDKELAVLVDTFDQLKTTTDPKAAINEAVVAAANRFFDDVIIANAFATAYTGVDASNLTQETFNKADGQTYVVSSTFGSGSAVGLTYKKIVEMRRLMRHYQNDLEADPPVLIAGSQQESDLLNQIEVIDKLYNDRPVVEDGRVMRILGTDIVYSERLVTDGTLRYCLGFVRSGLHLGVWKDMDIIISQRNDLSGHPWQIYSMLSSGACRTQLGKVFSVNAADTTGGDITM